MDLTWRKPVIVFYKERHEELEREPFAVVKARKLEVSRATGEESKFRGSIVDFFPLMGDIDYVSSPEGLSDSYILCWFEDEEEDFKKSWRRLTGVTFPDGLTFTTDEKVKRTYNGDFKAEQGKIR
ncbi:MAG: hypothetical protein ACOC6H_00975 [Thermoproteota archaeon]